tara:strand:- start:1125 stop:1568 length:444 start_codon:yes stop_codon:yes gene_type:complete
MSLAELKSDSESKAKSNKSAAVRWALLDLGYPSKPVGKPEVEEFLKTNKVKHKFNGNALSVAINGAKNQIDKSTGNAPKRRKRKAVKGKSTTKVVRKNFQRLADAAILVSEADPQVADRIKFAETLLDEVGGDMAKARKVYGIIKQS